MVVFACVTGALLLLFLFLLFPSLRRHPDRAWLRGLYIAHRGLHDLKENTPENSLAAFRAAIEHGFAIEIDIHLTADGEVVVFHDDTLQRMCGVDGRPEEKTLAELKQLRLQGTDEQIPTLQECLDTVSGKTPLLIEFKCSSGSCKALCRAADTILSTYQGAYCVQSFYPPVLLWYRRHRREICRGQLASAFPKEAIHKQLLGCMVFNCLARPDFVSYDHGYAGHACRRLCTLLGAHPVGWTFRTQAELTEDKAAFNTYIFEGFLPTVEEE